MGRRRNVAAAVLLAVATSLAAPAGAAAADGVLYELTEAVQLRGRGQFKSSFAVLSGQVNAATPICPAALAGSGPGCSVTVYAEGRADDDTGIGPATALFEVAVQDTNGVDGPEIVVLSGTMNGEIDLSPAFLGNKPLGSIKGSFQFRGVKDTIGEGLTGSGNFRGVFRLPFLHEGRAAYLLDNGAIDLVDANERSLNQPGVRLEVTFVRAPARRR
jgi:hypothetical protein